MESVNYDLSADVASLPGACSGFTTPSTRGVIGGYYYLSGRFHSWVGPIHELVLFNATAMTTLETITDEMQAYYGN